MVRVLGRISRSEPLLIKKLAAETGAMVAAGKKIISLAQGVPNLPIFNAAHEAMVALLDKKQLPYTLVEGMLPVRKAAADFVNKFYFPSATLESKASSSESSSGGGGGGATDGTIPTLFEPENVVITAGAIQAVYNVLALSVDGPSDVVVSPLPAYGLYRHTTGLLGGSFVPIHTGKETQFVPTAQQLRDVFRAHTVLDTATGEVTCNIRSVVLCYPNNPVGSMLTSEQAKEIAETLDSLLQDPSCKDGFSVILDEVYIGITSPSVQYHSVLHFASPLLLSNSFLIVSASKGLGAMPGARAGCLLSYNRALLAEILKIQSATSANASSIAQEGLRASLTHVSDAPSAIVDVHSHYSTRTQIAVDRLASLSKKHFSGFEVAVQPQATFYVLANFSPLRCAKTMPTDVELIKFFRDMCDQGSSHIGVASVPGSAFGLEPEAMFVRFSCAVDVDVLHAALDVIDEAVQMILVKHEK